MLRIGTDGSGYTTVIRGCPYCDNPDGESEERINRDRIRYKHDSHWIINGGTDRMSFRIRFCPFCGNKLPSLEGWAIVERGDK